MVKAPFVLHRYLGNFPLFLFAVYVVLANLLTV
jgi:hypothetical protein